MDGTGPLIEAVTIASPAPLRGQLFHPPMSPETVVLINGATGVPARFYAAFASWLAQTQGIACLIWDYRDFGQSGQPQRSTATMTDWGVTDPQAARDWLVARFPQAALWVIGHSLGGLTLPFQTGQDRITRVITVASGAVHLSDHPWPYRAAATAFWYGHAPVLAAATGHLPGRLTGFGPDLPAGVYWQWRRWCLSRRSCLDDPAMPPLQSVTAPTTLIAIADDALVPPAAVWRLMQWYPQAIKHQRVIRPADHGLPPVGHIAAFASANRALWPMLIA